MLTANYTKFKDNTEKYINKIADSCEALLVTKEDNKNIVIISEKYYNNLIENLYLIGNKVNYDWLMESKKQLENGVIKKQ